jgi:hypothetical protein
MSHAYGDMSDEDAVPRFTRVLLASFSGFAEMDSSIVPFVFDETGRGHTIDLPDIPQPTMFFEVAAFPSGSWWCPVVPVPPPQFEEGPLSQTVGWTFMYPLPHSDIPMGHQLRPSNLFWWVGRTDVADNAAPMLVRGGIDGSFPPEGL